MLNNINERLVKVKEELFLQKKWKKNLADFKKARQELLEKLEDFHQQWLREQKDVERLERVTLTNIIVSLSGKKYEKLDKEKQEEITARLRYESQKQELVNIEKDIQCLETNLKKFVENPEHKYIELLKEKEQLLIQENSEIDRKLDQVDDQLSDLHIQHKEMEEAITAGNQSLSLINDAVAHLNEAENWSTWDMFGGGMLTTAMKHSSLETAEISLNNAQSSLRNFQMELEDINEFFMHNIRMDGFTTFADYFFDGFFVDWTIHGKIKDSLANTLEIYDKVSEVVQFLENEKEVVSENIEQLQLERFQIIEQG